LRKALKERDDAHHLWGLWRQTWWWREWSSSTEI
jgi:hypothetical protein